MSTLAYMLDTSVLIDLLRATSRPIRAKFQAAAGRIGVSTVSVMELEYGIARSNDPVGNREKTESLLRLTQILPFTLDAAQNAGQAPSVLATSGMSIGLFDSLIAGHARSQGLVLVTNNVREFESVPDLLVENWLVAI
ncbi:MAG: PIN domain-containing protein [Propionibacteriaceae bacterium]|jgi:tRNA(fMet)-specific endonuclease VapC|nr:PIN domain-containing protein [Propionibacteriaceae bacterium]